MINISYKIKTYRVYQPAKMVSFLPKRVEILTIKRLGALIGLACSLRLCETDSNVFLFNFLLLSYILDWLPLLEVAIQKHGFELFLVAQKVEIVKIVYPVNQLICHHKRLVLVDRRLVDRGR